jgi:hypothetical protein
MMRSALYYPHTEVKSSSLLKTSLLLWDKLQYIVPSPEYEPYYEEPLVKEAIGLIGEAHFPTAQEKEEAHSQIEALVKRQLPASFYLPDSATSPDYEIWPQKLLPKTWSILEEAKLSGAPLANYDYPLSMHTGLTVMSILADCCAGKTLRRVTDRAGAYATVAGLLNPNPPKSEYDLQPDYSHLVRTSLKVVDASAISLSRLIEFRKSEEAEHGHSIRQLRHRYVDKIESYLSILADLKRKSGDEDNIKRQFEIDMKDDLAGLRDALKFARNEVFTSREIISAGVAAAGVIAALAIGAVPAAFASFVTITSAPVMIGGLFGTRNKYLSSRRAMLEKHPMAYLLELEKTL